MEIDLMMVVGAVVKIAIWVYLIEKFTNKKKEKKEEEV